MRRRAAWSNEVGREWRPRRADKGPSGDQPKSIDNYSKSVLDTASFEVRRLEWCRRTVEGPL